MAESIAEAVGQNFTTIKDRTGKEHRLFPLTIRDWVELEREIGSVFNWAIIGQKLETWAYVIWLSVRKNGITRKHEYARQFKIAYEEMMDIFDITQADTMATAVQKIFELSGMKTAEKPEPDSNHPTADAVAAETATILPGGGQS